MTHDKKSRGGEIRFVLASDVATWKIVGVSPDAVRDLLREWRERAE